MFEVDKCLWLYCPSLEVVVSTAYDSFATGTGVLFYNYVRYRRFQAQTAAVRLESFCLSLSFALLFPLSPPLCTILPAPGFLVSSQSSMAASSFDRNIKHLLTRKYDDYGIQVDFDDRTSDIRYFFSLQIIDPYVKLDFHGIQADTASFKTKVVKDNGNKQFLSTLLQNYDFMMRSLIG